MGLASHIWRIEGDLGVSRTIDRMVKGERAGDTRMFELMNSFGTTAEDDGLSRLDG